MPTIARTFPALLLFLAFLLINSASEASGYRNFGIFYPQSEAENLNSREIEWLRDAGITWLMVEETMPEPVRNEIREAGFSLYVLVPEYFPIPYRLTSSTFRYSERATALLSYYRHDPMVKGFGLFSYGKWQRPALVNLLRQLSEPHIAEKILFTLDSRPISGNELSPFNGTVMLTRNSGNLAQQLAYDANLSGILYAPEDQELSIRDFQEIMQLLDSRRDLPVFFYRDWFIRNSPGDVSDASNLAQITGFYFKVSDARIANPAPTNREGRSDLSILFLLVLWGFFASVYHFNPVYRKSIERFFLNYDFFVNDILMRRIRLWSESVITFVLSSLLAGVLAYAIAEVYLNSVSREALLHHLYIIPVGWQHPMVFFTIFFILTAITLFIQIAWLRVANRQHAQTYQITTFILWPQHLNLVIVSVGVVLLRSFPSEYIVAGMVFIFWAITLISFIAAAYNMRRIHPTSLFYIVLTYVLFILVSTSILSWLIYGLHFFSAWDLANSIASY